MIGDLLINENLVRKTRPIGVRIVYIAHDILHKNCLSIGSGLYLIPHSLPMPFYTRGTVKSIQDLCISTHLHVPFETLIEENCYY